MRKLYFLSSLCLILYSNNRLNAQCSTGRYYDQVFSSNSITTVQYGNAVEYNGQDTNLLVDIYEPTGDNLAHRPLMIFAFGGSFVSGVRQSPDLVILCTYFSQRGYVCASIDYRLGYDNCSQCDTNLYEAMLRGIQDMKAATRFFYKDAETVNQFHIDTNNIFIGGVSAGAFIALNDAYWSEIVFSITPPGFAIPALEAVGGIEGNSGNPGYSTHIKGVIDLSGAIVDTLWLQPGGPMLVGEHGTADSTVACYYDSAFAVENTKSSLFGGGDIKNRLSHINFNGFMYLFQGAGHCPFILPFNETLQAIEAVPLYMDSTQWIIRDFLYQNISCDPTTTTSGINEVAPDVSVSVFPNPSDNEVNLYSHYGKDLDVSVVTVDGRTVQRQVLPANGLLALQKADLGAGMYLLQLADKGTSTVLKTEKVVFY